MVTPLWFRSRNAQCLFLIALSLALPRLAQAQGGTIFSPLLSTTTQEKPDSLEQTIRVKQQYDTNLVGVTGMNSSHLAGTYSYLESVSRFYRRRAGSKFLFTADVGQRVYERFSSLNQPSFDMKAELQQRITERLAISLRERWYKTPQNGLEEPDPNQLFPTLTSPDANLIFVQRQQNAIESSLTASYFVSDRTAINAGGSYNKFHMIGTQAATFTSDDAYVNITRKMTSRQTIGAGFDHQWLGFINGKGNAGVNNILFNYANQLTPTLSLNAFGGPSFVSEVIDQQLSIPGVPFAFNQSESFTSKSWVGGASVDKTFGRNTVQVKYMRAVSNGSGLAGATLRQLVSAGGSRKVSKHLILAFNSNYTHGSASTLAQSYGSYRFWPSVKYQITPHVLFSAEGGYQNGTITQATVVGGAGLARTLISCGFEYKFHEVSLGR